MDRNVFKSRLHYSDFSVALRKESVDRNFNGRACAVFRRVALRKESVDRNEVSETYAAAGQGRSPQGERG